MRQSMLKQPIQVTIDGLSALVSAGLLTQARADEILVGLLEVVS